VTCCFSGSGSDVKCFVGFGECGRWCCDVSRWANTSESGSGDVVSRRTDTGRLRELACRLWSAVVDCHCHRYYISAVLKFLKLQSCPEIVLKSQSFSTNVLILTIAVRAQWQFNVLLAALLICLLHTWIQFYVLFLFETVTIMASCVTLPS